jgi:hypothetical protein
MAEEANVTLIQTDPNYIGIRRYKNSLKKVEDRYPNGCPDHIIADCLSISESDLEKRYQEIICLLKTELGV